MDTHSHPQEARRRLGGMLRERRTHLGYPFRSRAAFAAGSGLSDKTIGRLEKGEPGVFQPETIALAEAAYQWQPGSFAAVLGGGDPEPSPGSPGAPEPIPGLTEEERRLAVAFIEVLRREAVLSPRPGRPAPAAAPGRPARRRPRTPRASG